jgi:uncharacterized membrane protein
LAEAWARYLSRWTDAGLLDSDTAARIRAFERAHAGSNRLRWPIWIALGFGALMLGAGVLLFVSAHWDSLSPAARFAIVTLLVAVFHAAAAACGERFPAMATALHTVGTVALGGGIYLAGQIFNLDEHWPGGLMLWALGALIAWVLLQTWPQLALLALLGPAWLAAEWFVAVGSSSSRHLEVVACGIFLLALTYFTAEVTDRSSLERHVLLRIGGLALPVAAVAFGLFSFDVPSLRNAPAASLQAVGWAGAFGLPLTLAFVLRRTAAWPNGVAAVWAAALAFPPIAGDLFLFGWWALGAMALAAWGLGEGRRERINMGAAIFAGTVIAFYFSQVMNQLGRSASLVGLGALFLVGGWAIERARRRLLSRMEHQE